MVLNKEKHTHTITINYIKLNFVGSDISYFVYIILHFKSSNFKISKIIFD